MSEKRINRKQLWLWIAAAMIAPLTASAAGQSWVTVGITAAVCTALSCTLHFQIDINVEWSRWFCGLQWLWSAAALGHILDDVPLAWPQAEHPAWIVLILLLAALWSVRQGSEACSRVGATLFWIVGILMAVVCAAAVKDVRLEYIKPKLRIPDTNIFFVLLIPCAAILLPRREKGGPWILMAGVGVAALAVSFLTAGVLSPELAEALSNPFHEVSRTLTLSGAAQRFESLVSAGLTVSWVLLLCLLLSVAAEMWERAFPGKWGAAACAAAAVGIRLCGLRINAVLMAAGSVVFWGLLPVLAQGIGQRKKL